MIHAPSGRTLWTLSVPNVAANARHSGLVDAALIPPAHVPSSGSSSVASYTPDAIVMDRSGSVVRIAGLNGHPVWTKSPISLQGEGHESIVPIRVHTTTKTTFIVSLVQHQRLLSSTPSYSLRVDTVSAVTGMSIATIDIPGSNVDMQSTSSSFNTAGNVIVLGQDAHQETGIAPQLVWLQTDGTIRSIALPLAEGAIDSSTTSTLKPKSGSRFTALHELIQLNARGIFVARTNDFHGEVLRIDKKKNRLISQWEFEEDAKDAIYSGTISRQGEPYVNRIFFGRSQQLLNFHVLWADVHDGEGQVTGFSFQYDHDLNGDVVACPFEVSPVNEFQLISRGVMVTRSSSIRMIQEDRHQWIREEGLSHTTASVLIDLPEGKLGSGAGLQAKQIIEGEGFISRLQRHAVALQHFPEYVWTSIVSLVFEIPSMSLESFGIQQRPAHSSSGNTPLQTNTGGAAPFRGVGAQKQAERPGKQSNARHAVPKGVPPPGRKRQPVDQGPPPPVHLAPREANSSAVASLIRDKFGFRKLVVAASKKGKLYAVDSQTGQFIWEKSLVGFGQGEGDEVPEIDIKLLALVRPLAGSGSDLGGTSSNETSHSATAQLDYGGLLTVVAEVQSEGATFTRMWEIDPLTGRFPGGVEAQTGIALFPGKVKTTFLLPIEDEFTGQIAAAAVNEEDKFLVWPTTTSIAERFAEASASFFYAVPHSVPEKDGKVRSVLVGYHPVPAMQMKGVPVWQLPLASGEKIVDIVHATQDPVASQGKVLGDRSTLYKYLNPSLLVVLTRNEDTRTASVYAVDGVTGKVIYQSTLCSGNLLLRYEDDTNVNPTAVITENWLTVSYQVEVSADDPQAKFKGPHTQTRLLSTELYEPRAGEKEMWEWKGVFSSFAHKIPSKGRGDARSPLIVPEPSVLSFSQIYILPYKIRGLEATRTKYGISSKALLLATSDGRIQVLPRRLLDPRRPLGRKPTTQEVEEGLIQYDPFLQDTGRFQLGGRRIPLPSRLRVRPSLLESSSLVFVDQSLDWFFTTVAPSGSFDLLSGKCTMSEHTITTDLPCTDAFNKPQLLLTMLVLSVGYFVTRPMVAGKMLRLRW